MAPKTNEPPATSVPVIPARMIEQRIYFIRGHKVMLDSDLAKLYEVETRVLNQAVRRNLNRFPEDFMLELSEEEHADLRSHSVTLKKTGRGQHRKYLPFAFTEQGVAMLSTVLKSERAVEVNIQIMRSFVKLRSMMASNKELSQRLDQLESNYDDQFAIVFEAIRELMAPPPIPPKRRIGFRLGEDDPAAE